MNVPSPQNLLNFTGSGQGWGIALRFAEAGAAVIVNYRSSAAGAYLETIQ